MRVKILILFALVALATGTGVWAAKEATANAGAAPSAAQAPGCCGFCDPDEPCPFCHK